MQNFSLGSLGFVLFVSFSLEHASAGVWAEIDLPFFAVLVVFFIMGMAALFLAKVRAMESIAKKTYSNVGGLVEGKLNPSTLMRSLSLKSSILYY